MESNHKLLTKKEHRQNALSSIHHAIKHDWYLWEEERELLDKWYVLRWSSQYFQGKLQRIDLFTEGIGLYATKQGIEHDGIIYYVEYKEGYRILVKYTDQVQISFRRIRGMQAGIALVRTANRKYEHK